MICDNPFHIQISNILKLNGPIVFLFNIEQPSVFLSSGGKEEKKYLKCAVHGFYPNVIRVRWTRAGKPVYYGVSTTGILPHKDGRFQITSYLSLGNVSAHSVICEIEHLSINGKLRITYGKSLSD